MFEALPSRLMGRHFELRDYLIWSTVVSAFLLIIVAHVGLDIMLAYPIVVINTLILLIFDRLKIHRNHLIAIAVLSGFSILGMRNSSTPFNAVLSQVAGITVMSIYYFSALTTLDVSPSKWMELYIRAAFYLALLGLLLWPLAPIIHLQDPRLKSIYVEPSFFIYMTLPALGYCLNTYIADRRYGWELLIFCACYVFADSSLGFIGLLLALAFAFAPHFRGWQIILTTVLLAGLIAGLYFASANFQLRVRDTVTAVASQDLTGTNDSTWALLSNLYVVGRTVVAHPITGVGIGGYRYVYDDYISDLTGLDLSDMPELNKDDANSLFLRVAAELGLPGLVVLFSFIVVCSRVRGSPYREVRNAFMPYLLVRMGRYGGYFSPELYFFCGLYLFNYMQYRKFRLAHSAGTNGGNYALVPAQPTA
jgi:O-antigen ligase